MDPGVDPSGQIRSYLAQEAKELIEAGVAMQASVVAGSKVDVGIAITAKKLAAAESHIQGEQEEKGARESVFQCFTHTKEWRP